jgi:hypothetical protein
MADDNLNYCVHRLNYNDFELAQAGVLEYTNAGNAGNPDYIPSGVDEFPDTSYQQHWAARVGSSYLIFLINFI